MSSLSKAMGDMASSLAKTINFDLKKGRHDAMMHHALHACAAYCAGKQEEAAKHRFMHYRHALENVRGRGYSSMSSAMNRGVSHYESEAADELYGSPYASGPSYYGMDSGRGRKTEDHPLVKHFKGGGKFVAHAEDKKFKEDYEGKKEGPKVSG